MCRRKDPDYSAPTDGPWVTSARLSSTVIPSLYQLRIFPNISGQVFNGTEVITFSNQAQVVVIRNGPSALSLLLPQTDTIIMHAVGLNISNVVLVNTVRSLASPLLSTHPLILFFQMSGAAIPALGTFFYAPNEFFVIQFSSTIPVRSRASFLTSRLLILFGRLHTQVGTFNLSMSFVGALTTSLRGLYLSTYSPASGGTRSCSSLFVCPVYLRSLSIDSCVQQQQDL